MIKPISWVDILFFALFLVPNLIIQLSVRELISLVFVAVPYVVFILPLQVIYDRFTTPDEWNLFQNLVLRIVRFSFGNLSATVGRVFFSESQAFPFARFRTSGRASTWRKEVSMRGFKGYWICDPGLQPPADIVLLYVHGGGFTMGSTAFYLEFLMNIIESIPNHSLRVFSLEYSLVPESRYPIQLQELAFAYEHILTTTSSENIILSGDSAGATIILSFLMHISRPCQDLKAPSLALATPAAMILISPWCQIDSRHNSTSRPIKDVDEDFLDSKVLDEYARLYTATTEPKLHPSLIFPLGFYGTAVIRLCRQLLRPPYAAKRIARARIAVMDTKSDARDSETHSALCRSPYRNPFAALHYEEWLKKSLPRDCLIIYGCKETMADEIMAFSNGLKRLGNGNIKILSRWKLGWHAWPMVAMYLGKDAEETESGVKVLVEYITRVMHIKN